MIGIILKIITFFSLSTPSLLYIVVMFLVSDVLFSRRNISVIARKKLFSKSLSKVDNFSTVTVNLEEKKRSVFELSCRQTSVVTSNYLPPTENLIWATAPATSLA